MIVKVLTVENRVYILIAHAYIINIIILQKTMMIITTTQYEWTGALCLIT